MVRILIDDDVKSVVNDFIMETRNVQGEVISKLNQLICDLKKSEVKYVVDVQNEGVKGRKKEERELDVNDIEKYIEHLIERYDFLQAISPSEFDDEILGFEAIIDREIVNCHLNIKGEKCHDSLSKRIVKAMKYDKIRKKYYPKYIRQFNIKTCVYCNANYAITDAKSNAYYEVDHWKPQSRYPYLCTSFYNMQPSCSTCNKHKLNDDTNKYFHLWTDKKEDVLEAYKFRLNNGPSAEYVLNHKTQEDSCIVTFCATSHDYEDWEKSAKERLYIENIYSEHKDVVEEIIWKYRIYNDKYMATTDKLLNEMGTENRYTNKQIRDRFIMGNYCSAEDVHKRPLSKLVQDIGRQLGLL